MRPYLHLFYLYKYSILGTKKSKQALTILDEKSYLFWKFNPAFGRRIIKITNKTMFSNNIKKTESFNYSHINFESKVINSYNKINTNYYNFISNFEIENIIIYNDTSDSSDSETQSIDSDDEM